jgi:hypothetical protein
MAEPNPPRPHPGDTVAPVPDSPPMPAKAERNIGVAFLAVAGGILLLALVVIDTAGGLHGLRRIAYVAPALLLVAAGLVLLREATTSGRR